MYYITIITIFKCKPVYNILQYAVSILTAVLRINMKGNCNIHILLIMKRINCVVMHICKSRLNWLEHCSIQEQVHEYKQSMFKYLKPYD